MSATWPDSFLKLANTVAERSKDPSTKVGCIIVGPDKEIRSTGYNSLPRRVSDKPERMERPAKYLWTRRVSGTHIRRIAEHD